MTTLETERLMLRPLADTDADAITAHVGKLEVARWLTVVPHPYTAQDAARFLDDRVPFGKGGNFNFALTLHGSPELIGLVAVDASGKRDDHLKEFGYWLAPEHWRQGLMSEAAHAVATWAFLETDIAALHAGCHEANHGSRRILEALGFEVTGRKTVHSVALDTDRISLQFLLTRETWNTP